MNYCRKKNRTLPVFSVFAHPRKASVERSFPSKLLRNFALPFCLFRFFDLSNRRFESISFGRSCFIWYQLLSHGLSPKPVTIPSDARSKKHNNWIPDKTVYFCHFSSSKNRPSRTSVSSKSKSESSEDEEHSSKGSFSTV